MHLKRLHEGSKIYDKGGNIRVAPPTRAVASLSHEKSAPKSYTN